MEARRSEQRRKEQPARAAEKYCSNFNVEGCKVVSSSYCYLVEASISVPSRERQYCRGLSTVNKTLTMLSGITFSSYSALAQKSPHILVSALFQGSASIFFPTLSHESMHCFLQVVAPHVVKTPKCVANIHSDGR